MGTLADMTLDELKQLISDLIEERRLNYLVGNIHIEGGEPDKRKLEEVFASVERNRWSPPAGSPTPTEILRQHRDEQ
jgi:hypothetical protein